VTRLSKVGAEQRVLILTLLGGLPAVLAALVLLWAGDLSLKVRLSAGILVAGSWLGLAVLVRRRVVRLFQSLANILQALRAGDYSMRAHASSRDGPVGLAIAEINSLAATLSDQRLKALEATALLRKVMSEINVAVFAFDAERRLHLINREGERLLGRPAERVLLETAEELGLTSYLDDDGPRTIEREFPGGSGRWEVRYSRFREGGEEHGLLVISDLSRALREGEIQAWKRLVRVLSHEVNNSLAPIQSLSGSLRSLLDREDRPRDWEADVRRGLEIIAGRSGSLGRFMAAYARLARLPPPRRHLLDVPSWVRRVAALEKRLDVAVAPGPAIGIQADEDQLEQLLINLVRNAVDAVEGSGGGVEVSWRKSGRFLEVTVSDEGPGLADPADLFVPFYSTKPEGSGIGLVLGRQIAEAHGGSLTLENRTDRPGCIARVRLPL
jgi:nitrogen fixation/metabolism regulation signal transduction histidine kinase